MSATYILALSTAWNFQQHHSGNAMLEEISTLGFQWVELHQELSASLLPEITEFVKKGKIRISNLRNYCFLPFHKFKLGGPQFTAQEEEERELAIRFTQQTIDYAVQFEAGYVVLNCGNNGGIKFHNHLKELALQGKLYTKQFARAKIKEIVQREKESFSLYQRVLDCLRKLGDYASKRGIQLGIENAEVYEAFPTEREFPFLLEELNHPAFGYWHNFGHAQIKDHLTFIDHRQWLERIGSRAIGCSIDDVQELDHQYLPPFTGTIPYESLMPLLSQSGVFVLDLRGLRENVAILKSVEHWKNTFSKKLVRRS